MQPTVMPPPVIQLSLKVVGHRVMRASNC